MSGPLRSPAPRRCCPSCCRRAAAPSRRRHAGDAGHRASSSSRRSKNACERCDVVAVQLAARRRTSRRCRRCTPRSTRLTFIRLLMNSPAEMSSAIESAICAVTSDVRKRAAARAPDGWPGAARSVVTRSGRVLCSAGNRPNSKPGGDATAPRRRAPPPAAARTAAIDARVRRQQRDDERRASSRATSRPASPPSTASTHDSVSSCAEQLPAAGAERQPHGHLASRGRRRARAAGSRCWRRRSAARCR